MTSFKAYRVHLNDDKIEGQFDELTIDDLSEGEVVVQVEWSSINYKDALAVTGTGKILRHYPLVAGIDVAGTVESSSDHRIKEGDTVIMNGGGLSETRDGGYAEFARLPAEGVIPVPEGLSVREAMAIGTAGFSAGLAVHRMQLNGQVPSLGPIAVTGAGGGVGSIAIDMLAGQAFEVTAVTSKTDANPYLRHLGASDILSLSDVDYGRRPMEKVLWGGAVDSLGGDALAWLTRTTAPNGNIASIGLAQGFKLETTVMPFILRGVNLLGINSVETPRDVRLEVWARLATDLKPRYLDEIVTREISLDDLPGSFQDYIDSKITGRTLVRIGD